MARKTIRVDYIARVEGEGALDLHIKDGRVTRAHLRIFEPPRFFEAFLRGRAYTEAPDITARICGICPIAYQMSSIHAMERALAIQVSAPVRALRRALYLGEWIESHTLHVMMLHAPDFLGFPDAIQMAGEHGDAVRRALELKKIGNELMTLLGGREIHPVNLRVGGFWRVPSRSELRPMIEKLKRARDLAVEMTRFAAALPFPDFEPDHEYVSLRHPDEYPVTEGRVVSSHGLDIDIDDYETEFEERHVAHSTSLQSALKRRGSYVVGPLARYNLNFDRLPSDLQTLAAESGLGPTCHNPFKSIIVRSIEVVYACDESLRLLSAYEMPDAPYASHEPHAAAGCGSTEAPRGLIWHRYQIDGEGSIVTARIVPPTSQNQLSIEEDMCAVASAALDLPDDALRDRCEQAVRNYDPCISCSCHFLKLNVVRE